MRLSHIFVEGDFRSSLAGTSHGKPRAGHSGGETLCPMQMALHPHSHAKKKMYKSTSNNLLQPIDHSFFVIYSKTEMCTANKMQSAFGLANIERF